MHMADALLSPAVGLTLAAASAGALAISARKLTDRSDDARAPLMGVLGAFVFAGQMVNFTIPGTGSSGHLVGGTLLMMLLGPYAAFIVITSVVVVQALFFADGGLLAIGANVWNMGVHSCFVGYVVFRAIAGKSRGPLFISIAAVAASVITLELGAASVALQTVLSGRSELPLGKFMALMLSIHLPIGLIEGVLTVMVVNLVHRARPALIEESLGINGHGAVTAKSLKPLLAGFAAAALVIGIALAWFASSRPDGLEWSIQKTYGHDELPAPETGLAASAQALQEKLSILPDYGFKDSGEEPAEGPAESWPNVSAGSSVSGVAGSVIVLLVVVLAGAALMGIRGKKQEQ
jgi:cobalt/nickel transport system permease protein